MVEFGERLCTTERIFNLLAGLKEDGLAKRFTDEPLPPECGESAGSALELDMLIPKYYEQRGWTTDKGVPTRETLERLDLAEFIPKLEADGFVLQEKGLPAVLQGK